MTRFIEDMLQEMRMEHLRERSQGLEGTKRAIVEVAVKNVRKHSDEAKIKNELNKKGMLSCPPGYRWDSKRKDCVPKTPQDSVSNGSTDMNPSNGPGYNTWGRSGIDGDGYAWAEPNNWGMDSGMSIGMSESKTECKGCGKKRCVCICPRCAVGKAKCRCMKPRELSDSFNI